MSDLCLDPDQTDQGSPYVVVEPNYCVGCHNRIWLSESVVPVGKSWTYRCWCGMEIHCTPVEEPN